MSNGQLGLISSSARSGLVPEMLSKMVDTEAKRESPPLWARDRVCMARTSQPMSL